MDVVEVLALLLMLSTMELGQVSSNPLWSLRANPACVFVGLLNGASYRNSGSLARGSQGLWSRLAKKCRSVISLTCGK
jgi:hypothetical protein